MMFAFYRLQNCENTHKWTWDGSIGGGLRSKKPISRLPGPSVALLVVFLTVRQWERSLERSCSRTADGGPVYMCTKEDENGPI